MENSDSSKLEEAVDNFTRQNVRDVIRLEHELTKQRSFTDRLVDTVTRFCGTTWFVYLHVTWFSLWIGYDKIEQNNVFDPYPFQLLTLIVSLEAIILSAIILISQNRDAAIANRRSHLALQIELLSEQESTKMLKMLEQISKKMGLTIEGDPSLEVLEGSTDPEHLVKQIDSELKLES